MMAMGLFFTFPHQTFKEKIMEIINHTNPGQTPVNGDWIEIIDGKSSIKREHYEAPAQTAEEAAQIARDWRDAELETTDFIVPLSDHPERDDYLVYRVSLRDWPADAENFPDTKPELGD